MCVCRVAHSIVPLSNLSPVGAVFMLECGIDRAVLEKLRVHRPQGMAGGVTSRESRSSGPHEDLSLSCCGNHLKSGGKPGSARAVEGRAQSFIP